MGPEPTGWDIVGGIGITALGIAAMRATRWSQGRLPWLAISGLLAACLVDGLAEAGDFQEAGAHEPSPASSGFHQLGPLGYLADFQVGLTQVAPHEQGQVVPGSY